MVLFIPLMIFLAIVAGTSAYRHVRHRQGQAARGLGHEDPADACDFGDAEGFDVQRVFPPPYASGPWAHDAIPVLLPRELIVDLGEFRDLIIVEVDRIPGGTLGGPSGIVAHGIQRLLREACAGAGTDAAEERLAEWYAGVKNVRRRHTGGRVAGQR